MAKPLEVELPMIGTLKATDVHVGDIVEVRYTDVGDHVGVVVSLKKYGKGNLEGKLLLRDDQEVVGFDTIDQINRVKGSIFDLITDEMLDKIYIA